MKSLNRPMFKRGGKVSSRNNGIVSGFDNGGRVGLENGGDPQSMLELAESMYPTVQKPSGFSQSDYLRLAAAGADIMGAQPTGRSGFIGALQAASPALGSLGRDLGESMGEREARYQQQVDARNKFMLGAGMEDAKYGRDTAREDSMIEDERKYRTDELAQENKYKLEQIALDAELNPNDLVFYTRQYNKLVEEQSEYNSESPEYERIQRQMDKL